MGMRAQIKIEDTGVYLYTHWGSAELPLLLQTALRSPAGKARWGDPEYLARIIFEAMTTNSASKELGLGIGTEANGDLEYSPIVVNCQKCTILTDNGLQTFTEFLETEY